MRKGWVYGFLRFCAVAALAWLYAWPLAAAEMYSAARAINGKSFELAGGGVVRLASLQAPNLAGYRPGEPLAEEARRYLESLILGKKLRLAYARESTDRHGRRVAMVHDAQGNCIQAEMLKAGWAMVYGFADQRKYLPGMLMVEKEAREKKRGLWALPYYLPVQAEKASEYMGKFKLVEGRVLGVAFTKNAIYLNFGTDWKTDFTLRIASAYRRYFDEETLKKLQGRNILVRGWIYGKNGPMVDLTLPEMLEMR